VSDLSTFAITRRWPAEHPDRLQLYSIPTPNGVKVSIMLEETGFPYEPHLIDFTKDDQKSPEFESLNPNGKIPAIIDPNGPGGQPLALFESGAIQWVMFQVGGVGPMFGQVGFFVKFAGKDFEDKRPRDRYVTEAKRLLGVMDLVLENKPWFMGDAYTIADISMLGWVNSLAGFYGAGELVGFDGFGNVKAWLERGMARPAVQRGLKIPARD
jgi:GST-like protein